MRTSRQCAALAEAEQGRCFMGSLRTQLLSESGKPSPRLACSPAGKYVLVINLYFEARGDFPGKGQLERVIKFNDTIFSLTIP